MMSRSLPLSLTLALCALPAAALAEGLELPRKSPPASVTQRVGVTEITVTYSSPAVNGRKIWGGLVPYGKIWRTGANAATVIELSRDARVGGKRLAAGRYSLFTIPGPKRWMVVFNSDTELWGSGEYDAKKDALRITPRTEAAPARERMTFLFSDTTETGTSLDLEWAGLRVRIPIEVDTKAHVLANIDRTLSKAWEPHMRAADYLLESGGDLKTALEYADLSIQIQPNWRNHWVKARVLHRMGKNREARALVDKALASGDDSGAFEFYQGRMKDALKTWK